MSKTDWEERDYPAIKAVIRCMAMTAEIKHPSTAGHKDRVAGMAEAIGRRLGIDSAGLEGLVMAAILHDIGKVFLSGQILSIAEIVDTPGARALHEHVQTGYDVIHSLELPWPVADIVLQHHERWNGSGYPRGLYGEDILLEARILAVADYLDYFLQVASDGQPCKKMVLGELERRAGTLFDPSVVRAYLDVMDKQQPVDCSRLSSSIACR